MFSDEFRIKYIGGPTALIEVAGLRFLTDPSFDPKDSLYPTNIYTLHKLSDPALAKENLGHIDVVLLSHDHHFDNLDRSGRALLQLADKILTTPEGAVRLGGKAEGLHVWQTIDLETRDGRIITITGTPCRHGPVGGDRGPVTGFVLNFKNEKEGAVYITGDTVMYEGIEEVAKKFRAKIVVAFLGAAIVRNVGPAHLTMTAEEGVQLAGLFKEAKIIPLHFEGWEHFSESKSNIIGAFGKAGILDRLQWA
ncbi:MAG TPA: MBL fold metallo-hydrolase [Puia sp.]|nr:MBL fold metallo-hydrolase [Puia sp.]